MAEKEEGFADPSITVRASFKRIQIDPEKDEIVLFVAKKRNRNHKSEQPKLDRYIEG
jgi:hypothetical protein